MSKVTNTALPARVGQHRTSSRAALVILIVVIVITTLWNGNLLRQVGTSFDGLIIDGSPFHTDRFAASQTPLFWPTLRYHGLRRGDRMRRINGSSYLDMAEVLESLRGTYQPVDPAQHLIIDYVRDGIKRSSIVIPQVFTLGHFLDLKLPSLIVTVSMLLIASVVWRINRRPALRWKLLLICTLLAVRFGVEIPSLYFNADFFSQSAILIRDLLIPLQFALVIDITWQEIAIVDSFSVWVIRASYGVALVCISLASIAWLLLWTSSTAGAHTALYSFAASIRAVSGLLTTVLVISRVTWFRFASRTRPDLYWRNQYARMIIMGVIISIPHFLNLILTPILIRNGVLGLASILNAFDTRFLWLFTLWTLAIGMVRHHVNENAYRWMLIVPMLVLAYVMASLLNMLLINIYPPTAQYYSGLTLSYLLLLAVIIFVFVQSRMLQMIGTFTLKDREREYDVIRFSSYLMRQETKYPEPGQRVAAALLEQYRAQRVGLYYTAPAATTNTNTIRFEQEGSNYASGFVEWLPPDLDLDHDQVATIQREGWINTSGGLLIGLVVSQTLLAILLIDKRTEPALLKPDAIAIASTGYAILLYIASKSLARAPEQIRRDLHDTVLQDVHGVQNYLEIQSRRTDLSDVDRAGLLTAMHSLRDAVQKMRQIVTGRYNPRLANINTLIDEFRQYQYAIDYQIDDGLTLRVPVETQRTIHGWVQEALNNVHRHANARTIEIRITATAGSLIVRVDDDGKGVDPQVSAGSTGRGLRTIRDDAHQYRGEVQLTQRTPRGTRLEITIPQQWPNPADGQEFGVG